MIDARSSLVSRAALALVLSAPIASACSGGGAAPGGPDGGTTVSNVTTGGTAEVKFCNGLSHGTMSVVLSVEVGSPAVKFSAASGTCSTAIGVPCQTIPAGSLAVTMVDDQQQSLAMGNITLVDGEKWILVATLDDQTLQPTVRGGHLRPEYTCAEVDPFEVADAGMSAMMMPAADAGAAGDGGATSADDAGAGQ